MRRLLKIGEAAVLAGVTSRAIRHYHKVGLLAEPRRSDSGYRLYGAEELLRLARIRRLRTLGLSLKQIKGVLGDTNGKHGEHSLREALTVLRAQVTAEIEALEERRMRISGALTGEDPNAAEDSTGEPEALRLAKDILGDRLSEVSAQAWEQEKAAWSAVEAFAWPEGYLKEQESLIRYYAERPEEYRAMVSLGERLVALKDVSASSPEVERLAQEYIRHLEVHPPLELVSEDSVWGSEPYGGVFADILTSNMSQPQRRVLDIASKHFAKKEKL